MRGPRSRRVSAALRSHAAVLECAVVERTAAAEGTPILVAYVVLGTRIPREELTRFVEARVADAGQVVVVPITSLPLTAEGDVDISHLEQMAIADEALASAWEEALASIDGVTAAAVLHDHPRAVRRLHAWDLLPHERQANADRDARAGTPSPEASTVASGSRESLSAGGALRAEQGPPSTISDWLIRAAATDRDIIYIEADGVERRQSYRELLAAAERRLMGLRAQQLTPGDRVLLQCSCLSDFLEAFWACVLGGFIPVPLAVPARVDGPSAGMEALAAACVVLANPLIVSDRQNVDGLRRATATWNPAPRVLAVDELRGEGAAIHHRADVDAPALFMLTSGSTGTPKAVVLTHRNLWSRTAGSRQLNGFTSDEVSLNWMPLDHVAGLIYFHLRDVFLCCRQVQVATSHVLQDPLRWLDLLERFGATVTFAPNFAYGLVNDRLASADRVWDLSSVRIVLNGAEAIVARTARRFLSLLQRHGLHAQAMRPAWGMSETSSGVTYSDAFQLASTADDDAFVEVGRPIPGLMLRIVDETGRVVPEGVAGKLQVRGPMVTSGYYGNEAVTREAFTADGWFITGDLGVLRDGRLTITGREKDVVIINSVNYHCHTIEGAIEALPGVEPSYTAACAVRTRGAETDQLAVFFHPRSDDDRQLATLLDEIRATLTRRLGLSVDFLLPVAAADIPKTSLGKIQRAELSRRFAAGAFDAAVKRGDLIAGNLRTVPDWFFTSVWLRCRAPEPLSTGNSEPVLVFADHGGLGRELQRQLSARGTTSILVYPAERFEAATDGSFHVNPQSADDLLRLVAALDGAGGVPARIVHLWGARPYAGEAAVERLDDENRLGALSVIQLVRALAGRARPTRLLAVGRHLHRVRNSDRVAYERTPVLGVITSLPQEHPWLECRHVDLDERDIATAASVLCHELQAANSDRIVAYREGVRHIRGLARVAFPTPHVDAPLFAPGGFYVVTGGAGGIGERVCRMLAERFQAHLLLIGRTAADARIAELTRELARAGGDAAYAGVDVCDHETLEARIHAYETRWQRPLAGAIHLAGVYQEGGLIAQDVEQFAAVLRAKTVGTLVLHRLLARRTGTFMISSSSVAGFFGGAGVGAYAAANAFQEAFAEHHAGRGPVSHHCFSWSNWDGVGQSRDHQIKDAATARGYLPIAAELGVMSLLAGSAARHSRLLIGLDGGHRFVRRHMRGESESQNRLTIFYAAATTVDCDAVRSLEVRDAFGVPSHPEFVQLAELPRDADGGIDRNGLTAYWGGADRRTRTSTPQTATERRLAELWARTLSIAEVGLDDSFFGAGGDSLHALRLLGRIRDAFGVELPLRVIFDADTLRDLARVIEEQAAADGTRAGGPRNNGEHGNDLLDDLDHLSEDEIDRLLEQLDARQEPA